MRAIWIVAGVAAGVAVLGAASREAHADDPPARADDPRPARITIRGTVRVKSDGSAAAGATIVAVNRDATRGEQVAITEDDGRYALEVEPGVYDLVVYFASSTVKLADGLALTADTVLGDAIVDETYAETGCTFGGAEHYLENTRPLFGKVSDRGWPPVARDRTHRAWIAPVAAADAATAVVAMQGSVRLAGAPGVPLAFVQEVTVHTYRAPIGLAAGPGGAAEVMLRTGSNETHGDVHVVAGVDRGAGAAGVEALAGGPLKHDAAWIAAGVVARRDRDGTLASDGLVHFNYAASWAHQLEVVGLAQAHGDATRDGWAHARWTSKLDDAKLELHALATAEYLALPGELPARAIGTGAQVTDRVGGELGLVRRMRLAGHHQLALAAGGGTSVRAVERRTDTSVAAGDDWRVRPDLQLEAGVRAETRSLGAARATVIAPRVALSWDPTKEGRGDVFVAYQRVPHLDGVDWRADPVRFHEELAAGFGYHRSVEDPIMVGAIARGRRTPGAAEPELGVEGWLHYEAPRTALRVAATTLGRVATVLAQRTLLDRGAHRLVAGASLIASPTATNAGGALTWRHRGGRRDRERDVDADVSLEGFDGDDGPAARLALGITW